MTAGPAENMEALDRAMHLSNLRHELAERTFYYAATVREREVPPGETARLAEAKRRLIDDVVMVAPLAAHIVRGSRIACAEVADEFAREGPVTCFRVHEILRKTRRHPEARILLNGTSIARGELLAMYRMLTPNTNLEPLSPFTLYTLPRILLVGLVGGIVAGAWMGRQHTPEVWIDFRAALIGGGLAAAAMSLLGQFALSRNMARTAPWNAALYNDINLFLYRQDPALLYLARCEFMERNHFIKGGLNGRRYHERARAIETGAYVEVLRRQRERLLARG
ncbi:MAG: hypothetical protein ABSG50_16100 [Opitutaceae bacterium]|jgi:hypothetical protein